MLSQVCDHEVANKPTERDQVSKREPDVRESDSSSGALAALGLGMRRTPKLRRHERRQRDYPRPLRNKTFLQCRTALEGVGGLRRRRNMAIPKGHELRARDATGGALKMT